MDDATVDPAIHPSWDRERDALAARLAAVEALARKWELEWKENPTPTNAEAARYGAAKVLRAALATGANQ